MITIQKHTHRQSVKNIPVKADDHNPTMNINSIPTRGIDRGKGTKPSGKWFRFGMVGYAISGSRYPIQINDHRSCCYLPRGTTPEAFPRGLKFHLPRDVLPFSFPLWGELIFIIIFHQPPSRE